MESTASFSSFHSPRRRNASSHFRHQASGHGGIGVGPRRAPDLCGIEKKVLTDKCLTRVGVLGRVGLGGELGHVYSNYNRTTYCRLDLQHRGMPQGTGWGPNHFRSAHAISEMTALISSIVVIGKKNVNPGRLITISPGKRNRGRRPRIITPSAIRRRCMQMRQPTGPR